MENKLYAVKVGEVYVRSAFESMGNIDFTTRRSWAKMLSAAEKDFVLKHFPDANVKAYDVVQTQTGDW